MKWLHGPWGQAFGVVALLAAIAGAVADWIQYPTAGQRVRTLLLIGLAGWCGWLLSALQAERQRRRAAERMLAGIGLKLDTPARGAPSDA